ncbi:ATP-dependent 6-phosphofructokinase [Spirulina subsalsa]|uniref:ATP-dependent 6-phosphofructokinase n=1 Tax=Spirulina subsalsa TaxID=54311 RepID=UPI0002EA9B3F|nr:ATP-dependent 6-phosphofructokinase [Spirulina subsalsa]
MGEKKRIGVLTSGGDCAGLNATIRAIVNRAVVTYGWEVVGIKGATNGLMTTPPEYIDLQLSKVESLLTKGGTLLGTTNKGEKRLEECLDLIVENYHRLNLNALIGIGGDGSLAILHRIAKYGNINFVGIPKTIDNDVYLTEYAIGYQTAVNVATEALDRLHSTAESHERIMILEVMGRDAGHIALNAGIAGGAHIILIPEIPYNIENICRKIAERKQHGFNHTVMIVSEAVYTRNGTCRVGKIGQFFADMITELTGIDTRVTVLGHVQRGGMPSPADRILASSFGVAAVDLIAQENYNKIVAWQNHQVVPVPIEEATGKIRIVDPHDTLVKTAVGLGIYIGEHEGTLEISHNGSGHPAQMFPLADSKILNASIG